MEKQDNKKSEEILAEIYRNAHLALQSISNILPEVDDHETRLELERQHEEYERFSAKAAMILTYYKIKDDLSDKGFFSKIRAVSLLPFASSARKKLLQKLEKCDMISEAPVWCL